MRIRPVIERELRAAARKPWTTWARVVFALVAIATCWVILALPRPIPSQRSLEMLGWLGCLGFLFALFSGCFLTADTVSREKREGTLGLLFLTPLRSFEILSGKMVAHSLQVVYGLLAAFPVFFLPLLSGGITWAEVVRVLLALLVTLFLSLSAGLFFSVLSVESKTPVMATLVAVLALTLLPFLAATVIWGRGTQLTGLPQLSPGVLLLSAYEPNYRGVAAGVFWPTALLQTCLGLGLIGLATLLLRRVRFQGEGRFVAGPASRIDRPGAGSARPRRLLADANPYEALTYRSAREAPWLAAVRDLLVLLFAGMLVLAINTSQWLMGFITAFSTAYFVHLIAKVQLALESTRQTHADHRSGALELILVTPLPADQIVKGAQRAVRRVGRVWMRWQLVLNGALVACTIVFYEELHMSPGDRSVFAVFFLGGIGAALADRSALEWMGLRRALSSTTHLRAALLTLVWRLPGSVPPRSPCATDCGSPRASSTPESWRSGPARCCRPGSENWPPVGDRLLNLSRASGDS